MTVAGKLKLLKTMRETLEMDRKDPESRMVAGDNVKDIIISTVYTLDLGYETALIDKDEDVLPVERYKTKGEAERGHKRWVKKVGEMYKSGNCRVTRLGHPLVGVKDKEMELSM